MGDLIEGVHPFGQIMEVLAVPLPFQPLVQGLIRAAFRLLFADPQPTASRVEFARMFI